MATITIDNAVVFRIIPSYGFEVTEEQKLRSGEMAKFYYTVWSKETVSVGDVLVVEGNLSVKVDEYTNKLGEAKVKANVNVNDAMIMSATPDLNDAPF